MTTVPLAHDDRGAGPVVVLLHGHPFDRSMWAPQLGALSDGFRVIAPDLRGYGASPVTPGCVTMGELAADVWALLGELGVSETAVVGLSMGGLIAMEMAIGRSEAVWALALLATTAQAVTPEEAEQREAMASEVEAEGMAPLLAAMGPRLFARPPAAPVLAGFMEAMSATDPRGAAAAVRGRGRRPDYRPGLRELTVPSLVCAGTRDTYSTAEVTWELIDALAAPRTLILPGVGHLPNLEEPDRVTAELRDFLTTAAGRRGG